MEKPPLPLSGWVERRHPLPIRFYEEGYVDIPDNGWGVWVAIEEQHFLHHASTLVWHSLNEAIAATDAYLSKASQIINGLEGGWLDSEEREMILSELGPPPNPCLPIYVITTESENREQVQYIGKTAAKNRFKNGHPAISKLIDPAYDNHKKFIYRCSIWFYINNEYISIEWIKPKNLAFDLIDAIESNLIVSLSPHLNSKNTQSLGKSIGFDIHIQNFSGSEILNDEFIWNAI